MTNDLSRLVVPDESIWDSYRRLLAEVNNQVREKHEAFFPAMLQCGPGCTKCCIRFSLLPLEAALVLAALAATDFGGSDEAGRCVLLRDGLCAIYGARPLICRTQGLPLGYVDEEREAVEVSACDLNFADDYAFGYDELLLMDRFNTRLAELNGEYCEAAGLNPRQRIAIADLLKRS